MQKPQKSTPDVDNLRRHRQNLMVLAALLLLLLLGLWLFHEIKGYLKVEACVEAGFRNCGATEQ